MPAHRAPEALIRIDAPEVFKIEKTNAPEQLRQSGLLRADESAIQNSVDVRRFPAEGDIAARIFRAREGADGVHRSVDIGEKIEFAARLPGVARQHFGGLHRQIVVERGPSLGENFLENIAHGEDGGACVDARASNAEFTHLAARRVEFLDDGHIQAFRGETDRSGQTSNSGADDDNALFLQKTLP